MATNQSSYNATAPGAEKTMTSDGTIHDLVVESSKPARSMYGSNAAGGDTALQVDSKGRLKDAPPSSVNVGQDTNSSTGATVTLNGGSSLAVDRGVEVKASSGETGVAYVGDTSVSTGNGYPLEAGEKTFIKTNDVANVGFATDTSGFTLGWHAV